MRFRFLVLSTKHAPTISSNHMYISNPLQINLVLALVFKLVLLFFLLLTLASLKVFPGNSSVPAAGLHPENEQTLGYPSLGIQRRKERQFTCLNWSIHMLMRACISFLVKIKRGKKGFETQLLSSGWTRFVTDGFCTISIEPFRSW